MSELIDTNIMYGKRPFVVVGNRDVDFHQQLYLNHVKYNEFIKKLIRTTDY